MHLTRSLLLPALAAAALVGGCGGDDRPASGSAGTPRDEQRDLSAFADCMRKQGVDVRDPNAASHGDTIRVPGNVGSAQLDGAHKACQEHLPKLSDAERDPARTAELQDKALKFAECMRRNGVDFPDPKVSGGGMVTVGPGGGADPSDPVTERARKRCQDLLPTSPER